MSMRLRRLRPALAAALLFIVGLLSCGREVTGPGGRGALATVALNPVFGTVTLAGTGEVLSIGSVVDFNRVRVVLLRANGDTAVDQLVPFPPESTTVRLSFNITLGEGATSQGEPLDATLKYLNAAGDTVFSGGPIEVLARPSSNPGAAPDVPLDYTGPGANAASIVIAPPNFVGTINQGTTFSAVVRDSQNTVLANAPIAFTSTDSNRVRVNIRTGATTLLGARGSARIIAQTLTGQADTADVTITPTPSNVVLVSGGAQQVRAGDVFPQPIRVRVNAIDGIGVGGVTVDFSVAQGGGSVAPPSAVTDANGEAVASWTAGTVAGPGTLRASILSNSIGVNVAGSQLSAAPTTLQLTASPNTFAAGDTIPSFSVLVLDATGDTVPGFTGDVTLSLTGGAGNANLVGTTTRAAVDGVAVFNGLTVNRAGTGYRIVAQVTGVPNAQSALFNVTAAPPRFVTLIGGGNQTAPASTTLADSIRVRVTDVFGFPIVGATVNFTVAIGGGTVSPTSRVTDVDGRAATSWTLGSSGTQQITAGVTGLNPIPVSASIFTGSGSPTLFMSAETVSTTVGGTRNIPIFVNPAATSTVVAQLVSRDTTIADWQVDSVVFTTGSTLRSPSLIGRAQGSTWAVVTSSIGTDSILVAVDSASVGIRLQTFTTYLRGDTLRTVVVLSEPAPPGGITAVVRGADPTKVQISPWSGRGTPVVDCEFYCSIAQAEPAGPAILAPPADSALITIPAGGIAGQVAIFLVDSTQSVDLLVRAPGYVSGGVTVEVREPDLQLFSSYSTFGTPIPIGSREEMFAQLTFAPAGDRVVRLTARRPSSVRVDSIGIIGRGYFGSTDLYFDVLAVDSSWVLVEVPGVESDSFLVRGRVPATMISLTSTTAAVNDLFPFSAGVVADTTLGANFFTVPPRAADLPLSIISRNPAVAQIDVGSSTLRQGTNSVGLTLRTLSLGSTWIVVAAQGASADSALVTVQAGTITVIQNGTTIGSGLIHRNVFVDLSNFSFEPASPVEVSVVAADTNVIFVATPSTYVGVGGSQSRPIILVGRNPGSTNLTFSAPGFAPVVRSFSVSQARIVLSTFSGASFIDPDSLGRGLSVRLSDASGFTRGSADSLTAVVRTTNPAVMAVTDSVIRFNANGDAFGGVVRAVGPGTAFLIVGAPGAVPDTSGLITVRAPRLDVSSASISTGVGLRQGISVIRRALPGIALPVTVTIQGPASVTAASPTDTIPANTNSRVIFLNTGTVLGADTVIFSSPGLASDTIVLAVGNSRVSASMTNSAYVGQDIDASPFLRPVATFSANSPDVTRRFVLTVRDTSVLAIVDDTAEITPAGITTRVARIRARRPGQSWVRFIDPTGLFQSLDSVLVNSRALALGGNSNGVSIGMRERTDDFEHYVFRDVATDDSLWVRLTSSNPSLVSTPDSVLLLPGLSFAYFPITTGDTVGAAYVTGSAPGFLPFRWFVNVTRSQMAFFASGGDLTVGNSRQIAVYTQSAATGAARATLDSIPVRIRSSNPSIVRLGADSVGFVEPLVFGLEVFGPVQALALGTSIVTVEDTRVGLFRQLLPGREQAEVLPARLQTDRSTYTVTPGLLSTGAGFVQTGSSGDSADVTVTTLGGRVIVTPNSLPIRGLSQLAYFNLRGASVGLDTVVFSAPGYIPDTAQVQVALGFIRADVTPPPRFFANESVAITVRFTTAALANAQVGPDGLPLTFTSSGQMSARSNVDGTPLSAVALPGGVFQYTFVLRALSQGGGTVTISAPGLAPLVIRTDVIVRPE
ncbi:MAG: beta strand repeat-containing protein [Gemmatimonadaceae bacterium]